MELSMLMSHKETPALRRGFGVAILVTLAGLTLAGCAGNAAETAKPKAAKTAAKSPKVALGMAGAPKVGDCWATSPALIEPLAWKGKAAVSCKEVHNAVTYAVGKFPDDTKYAKIEANGLSGIKALEDSCSYKATNAYLNHVGANAVLRVSGAVFAPTKAQWDAGSRWFRCDLGSPDITWEDTPSRKWEPLPVDFRAAVTKDDMPFRICSNASLQDPKFNGSVFGKCDNARRWLSTKRVAIPSKAGAAFPGAEALGRRARTSCPSSATQNSTIPTRRDWTTKQNENSVMCWEWRTGPA